MLSVNFCVQFGLFNGVLGYVVDIVYKNGRNFLDGLLDVVMVNFLNYLGFLFIYDNVIVVLIFLVIRQVECFCYKCKRI